MPVKIITHRHVASLDQIIKIQEEQKFFMSVSYITFLLKLYKYWDISSSGRDIFLKFSGDILWVFVH